MRRADVELKRVYGLAKEFLKERRHGSGVRTGRPRKYSDALILTLMAAQNLWHLSFRETLAVGGRLFGKVPAVSNYHYRVSTMPAELISDFISFVAKRLVGIKKKPLIQLSW